MIVNLVRGLVVSGEKVLLINFKNGALHRELSDLDPSRLTVTDNDTRSIRSVAHSISTHDVIVTTHFYSVFRLFRRANPKFFFYCVNDSSLSEANRFFGKINFPGLTRKCIFFLREKAGILFGDQYALTKNAERFNFKPEDFKLLPVPVPVPPQNKYLERLHDTNQDAFGFTYVGRAVDWKIYPVKKLIRDLLNRPFNGKKVALYIVTDNAVQFQKQLPPPDDKMLRVEFFENLSQKELTEFLCQRSDLHFGMGTAALDGARLGIPTVLLDLAFREFPENYRYDFVQDSDASFIGTDAEARHSFPGMTMDDLLTTMCNPAEMKQLSQETYQYMVSCHDISKITARLMEEIDHCTVHLKDTSKFLLRYLV